ncbi:CtsR family transcriptional regulator [Alkaliphilus serpentinus]|uniref:Transcriptional regulator CtsR n=1 Tax=Alkaliphilus serpentinus TaxID=1482731 RepID=A0A833M940_9FIRM|nr:CtsR family transcriptional regulator [Alkaliphilus serpentinus]KAB3532412.1 CtsR family transcriptional regulator [Alkaliphilus serpentinus]
MARISDIIEEFIKELIRESNNNAIEIQRNEMAKYFDCSPSQINYVLMTRFTLQQGYTTESQRGGGGYIKVTQLLMNQSQYMYHIITKEIGNSLTKSQGARIVQTLKERGVISHRETEIMRAAIDDSAILSPINMKDQIRAGILKNILATLLS